MRTSVLSVAGLASSGSRWRKSPIIGAIFQTESSRVPSKRGARSVRAAAATRPPRLCPATWAGTIVLPVAMLTSSENTPNGGQRDVVILPLYTAGKKLGGFGKLGIFKNPIEEPSNRQLSARNG